MDADPHTAGEHEADIRRVARTHIAGLQGQVAQHRADVRERDIEIDRLRAENARLAMMSKDCANRTAVTSLGFLAKIARDRLGYANRRNESNAEMIGRLLNDYADRHPLVGATRYGE
jgi:hypothetical protein